MNNHKILISGTGRCGTTFLIKLLSYLGLDTGFNPKRFTPHIDPIANAGMELFTGFMKNYKVPYILKSPAFIEQIDEVVTKTTIDFIIIPIRDYNKSAESRYRLKDNNTG